MPDPLESSRRKIAKAEEHFTKLQETVSGFIELEPYEQITEPHPLKPDHVVHKIRLTRPLPPEVADIVGDLIYNLRSALDVAGYAVSVASGARHPKNTAFPFAGSVERMSQSLGRSKDIPEQIQSLFCGFQPYQGGDDLLWAINEVCNTDKHKMLIPIGQGMVRLGARVHGSGFFEMPDPHVWDSAKNEMVLITFGPDTEFKYEFHFNLFVAFNDIKVVAGKEVLRTLHQMGSKVHSILMAIEAEARRIKIFT